MKTLTEFSVLFLQKAAAALKARAAETLEGDALRDALAADLACTPERAAHVISAVGAVGERMDGVRLVRVYQGEKAPFGAVSHGEFHFVVDRVAAPKKERPRDEGDRPRREKSLGLKALRAPGNARESAPREERVSNRDIPRAGIGWQLTSAPRDPSEKPRGKGGPRGRRPDGRGGKPGGPRGGAGGRPSGGASKPTSGQ